MVRVSRQILPRLDKPLPRSHKRPPFCQGTGFSVALFISSRRGTTLVKILSYKSHRHRPFTTALCRLEREGGQLSMKTLAYYIWACGCAKHQPTCLQPLLEQAEVSFSLDCSTPPSLCDADALKAVSAVPWGVLRSVFLRKIRACPGPESCMKHQHVPHHAVWNP